MRLKGMHISIDDFGTGYSSLTMLRQMPFSEIKIDQSFVADVITSRDSQAIVKSIIDLAANMDLGCVAEGVETEDTAVFLEQLGACDLQGYLIARPMAVEAIPAWLALWLADADGRAPAVQPDALPVVGTVKRESP
jgi:EAL domain-containing protein (putative c-di-GMP-specific phosphodiesterase class I)